MVSGSTHSSPVTSMFFFGDSYVLRRPLRCLLRRPGLTSQVSVLANSCLVKITARFFVLLPECPDPLRVRSPANCVKPDLGARWVYSWKIRGHSHWTVEYK
ncbi:hypothetical protein HAX54_031222 [Datura stramonium]|uniref:Uncharacterized protein n=1 Tax=Datura stramonium TaxID=4076 RepID=A0ABS8SBQ1_DATST|nr:hypothetical protein [Datura stramonium]